VWGKTLGARGYISEISKSSNYPAKQTQDQWFNIMLR